MGRRRRRYQHAQRHVQPVPPPSAASATEGHATAIVSRPTMRHGAKSMAMPHRPSSLLASSSHPLT